MLYNFAIWLYGGALRLAAFFLPKARHWVQGRRHWRRGLSEARARHDGPWVWVHCASLGEFEQGRPLIEALKTTGRYRILLSFFSPSGYLLRKNYEQADAVVYLPLDTPRQARDFVALARPDMAIFVKYEFWFNHLAALQRAGVPTYSVSALFRPDQVFFRPWGGRFKRILAGFSHIFVQDAASLRLLQAQGIGQATLAGDTRADRVHQIAAQARHLEGFEAWRGTAPVFIAGSTWPPDEGHLQALDASGTLAGWRWIIAPHDISPGHLAALRRAFPDALPYSLWQKQAFPAQPRQLIIDNIGMLNALYRYGDLAYIGGGFGAGIHNTLEPAAFGLPIVFGPKFGKFKEAVDMIAEGGAASIGSAAELQSTLAAWLQDPAQLKAKGQRNAAYIRRSAGASQLILRHILPDERP